MNDERAKAIAKKNTRLGWMFIVPAFVAMGMASWWAMLGLSLFAIGRSYALQAYTVEIAAYVADGILKAIGEEK